MLLDFFVGVHAYDQLVCAKDGLALAECVCVTEMHHAAIESIRSASKELYSKQPSVQMRTTYMLLV